ncbi:efflux RND transporter permease subunit [uncultured Bacteroides sp.]|uniref:efflux RND transporter permease subunit n=1 Tax=uncultured Bacteroides sp. TaxID=162156 RepID=UPI002AAB794A|nr:efflux RND transporter permease subunit [uncultured Bacteroides sp.]
MSKRKINIVELAMRHRQIVILIASLLVMFGVYSLTVMPKQEFPIFTIRQGLVIGVYPGATSAEVEEQLTKPLEKFIFTYKEVKKKKTYSTSKDGMVIVNVELNDDVKNKDEFWSKFKHGLEGFKAQLPSGVMALMANDDFGDTSALLITLESEDKTYRELEKYLEELQNRLRRIDAVSNLRSYGLQKEQISIYIEQEKLAAYGISSTTLAGNLFTQGFTSMSGSVDNKNFVAPIHVSETYKTERDVAEQIIYSDPTGHVIRLKDVARVVREYPDPDSYIKNNGKKCILLSMEMRTGNNIVQFGKDVNEVLESYQKELPKSVNMYRIADQSKVVGDSVFNFLKELMIAIGAVIIVIMCLLPMRVASIAASTIPISIFISLGLFYAFGIELNTVTLAALIVTLGMIVDNSIVIIDSYLEHLDEGMSRWHASVMSAMKLFKSIFSATLAISITFFPFLITTTGMYNDFLKVFPWSISIILGISLLVAMLLVPYMQYFFITKGLKQAKEGKEKKKNMLDLLQEKYEVLLDKCFKHPWITLSTGVVTVVVGCILFSTLPQRLMPIAERNQFAVEFYLPKGTAIEQTAAVVNKLEGIMKKDKRVVSITSFVGEGSPRFHTSYAPNMPGSNYAQYIVNTVSSEATVELLDELTDKYSNYFPNTYVRFKQLDNSDARSPIEVRLSGDSLKDLNKAGEKVLLSLRNMEGLSMVRPNFEEQTPGAMIQINNDEANRLGITKSFVAANMAMRFGSGIPLTTLWDGDYPMQVKLKAERKTDPNFEDLGNEYVQSIVPGVSVPLRQIANIVPDWTEGQIVRRNGVRTLSINADVKRGKNTTAMTVKVEKRLENISLPKGVTLSMGGQKESDGEALPQIIGALLIAIVIIFFILLFHFRKINLALLILVSMTLTVFGAAIGVLVMKQDVSMTGILGIVSLMGILVRNGIIMLDYAEELRNKHKLPVYEAALEAGKRRMRPIFLTSAAASMGVIPMIISNSPLWGPMGTVICFGTLISMVLVVTVLPIAYWLIFRGNNKGIVSPE